MAINENMGADAIKSRIAKAYNSIETMFVGVITSVDPVNMRYGVRPVLNGYDPVDKVSIESAILVDCPMMASKCGSFFIRLPYAAGDMVYVGVCKHSIDEAIVSVSARSNQMAGTQSFRQVDGVILGGLLSESEPALSGSNTSDFLIQNRNTNDKFVILAGGGIEIVTKTKVFIDTPETEISGNLKVNGNINVVGDGTIGTVTTKAGVTLDGHTHTYNPGDNPQTSTGTGEG